MKTARYRLTGKQVNALFNLLMKLNLLSLSEGMIKVVDDDISPEDGEIISKMFYDDEFAKEITNE